MGVDLKFTDLRTGIDPVRIPRIKRTGPNNAKSSSQRDLARWGFHFLHLQHQRDKECWLVYFPNPQWSMRVVDEEYATVHYRGDFYFTIATEKGQKPFIQIYPGR